MTILGKTIEKVWSESAIAQLRNKTKAQWIRHLESDSRWKKVKQQKGGSAIVFELVIDKAKTVAVHYHAKKTFSSSKLVKALLEDICWTEDSLKRDKFIK